MKVLLAALLITSSAFASQARVDDKASPQARVDDDVLLQQLQSKVEAEAERKQAAADIALESKSRYIEVQAILAALRAKAPELKGLALTKVTSEVNPNLIPVLESHRKYLLSDAKKSIICRAQANVDLVEHSMKATYYREAKIEIECFDGLTGTTKKSAYIVNQEFKSTTPGQFDLVDESGALIHYKPVWKDGKIVQYQIRKPGFIERTIREALGTKAVN